MEGSATRVNFQVEAKCDEANGFLDASKEVQNKQAGIEYENQDDDEAIVTLSSVYSLYHPTIFNCLYELYIYSCVFFGGDCFLLDEFVGVFCVVGVAVAVLGALKLLAAKVWW